MRDHSILLTALLAASLPSLLQCYGPPAGIKGKKPAVVHEQLPSSPILAPPETLGITIPGEAKCDHGCSSATQNAPNYAQNPFLNGAVNLNKPPQNSFTQTSITQGTHNGNQFSSVSSSSGYPSGGNGPSGYPSGGITHGGSGGSGAYPSGSLPSGYPSGGNQGNSPSGSYPSGGAPSGGAPLGGSPSGSYPSGGAPSGSYPSGGSPSGTYPSGGNQGNSPSGYPSGGITQGSGGGNFPQNSGSTSGTYPSSGGSGSYPQNSGISQVTVSENKPDYSQNPFLSGQVSTQPGAGGNYPSKGNIVPCNTGKICVKRNFCDNSGFVNQNAQQGRGQDTACNLSNGEICCTVTERQDGPGLTHVRPPPGSSPGLVHVNPNQPSPGFIGTGASSPAGSAIRNPGFTQGSGPNKPYDGPLNTTPHPGCPAALKCVSLEYCTWEGVMSDTLQILTREQQESRVPTTECSDPATGLIGKCCRDPNYKDPWPDMLPGGGCYDGTSCEVMERCDNDRMAQPKATCNLRQQGSVGICCINRGGSNYVQQASQSQNVPQRPPPQNNYPQQSNQQPGFGNKPNQPSSYPQNQPQQTGLPSQTFTQNQPAPGPAFPKPVTSQQQPGYPQQPSNSGFPQQPSNTGFSNQPSNSGSNTAYPNQPSNTGFPNQPSNTGNSPSNTGYPNQPSNSGGPGFQQQPSNSGFQQQPSNTGYPQQPNQQKPYPQQPSNSAFPQQPSNSGNQPSHSGNQPSHSGNQPSHSGNQPTNAGYPVGQPVVAASGSYPGGSVDKFDQNYEQGQDSQQPEKNPTGFFQQQSPSATFGGSNPGSNPSSGGAYPRPQQPQQAGSQINLIPSQYPQLTQQYNPGQSCGVRRVNQASGFTGNDGQTVPGEFPWVASISSPKNSSRLCAGALISDSAVLCSAHCVQGARAQDLNIEVGSWSPYQSSPDRQTSSVAAIARHPQFDEGSLFNDMSVLLLSSPVRLGPNVDIACLPENNQIGPDGELKNPGGACVMTSWPKQGGPDGYLHRLSVNSVPKAKCEEQLRQTHLGKYFQLNRSFMCATPVNQQNDICSVSLGGPMVCPQQDGRYVVTGATSWDVGCTERRPAVMCALDVTWVNEVLTRPVEDFISQEQQQINSVDRVDPDAGKNKPGFSQGYGK